MAIILPAWLLEVLPSPKPAHTLSYENNVWTLTSPTGDSLTFNNVSEAYEASKSQCKGVSFHESVYEAEDFSNFLSFTNIRGSKTLFFDSCDDQKLIALSNGYRNFLHNSELFMMYPNDAYRAWTFLDTHPAFWTARNFEQNPLLWWQDGQMSHATHSLFKDDCGGTYHYLTIGSTIRDENHEGRRFDSHYGDFRLEIEAKSYDEAVIKLAKTILGIFSFEGEDEMPNLDYELELNETLIENRKLELKELQEKFDK